MLASFGATKAVLESYQSKPEEKQDEPRCCSSHAAVYMVPVWVTPKQIVRFILLLIVPDTSDGVVLLEHGHLVTLSQQLSCCDQASSARSNHCLQRGWGPFVKY